MHVTTLQNRIYDLVGDNKVSAIKAIAEIESGIGRKIDITFAGNRFPFHERQRGQEYMYAEGQTFDIELETLIKDLWTNSTYALLHKLDPNSINGQGSTGSTQDEGGQRPAAILKQEETGSQDQQSVKFRYDLILESLVKLEKDLPYSQKEKFKEPLATIGKVAAGLAVISCLLPSSEISRALKNPEISNEQLGVLGNELFSGKGKS